MALFRSRSAWGAVAAMTAMACGGGGDGGGGTGPVVVTSVVITAPAAPPSFATLGRTVQFTAEPRDASGSAVSGQTITWTSSSAAVATVSAAGVVTAVGSGTTQIRANVGSVQSTAVTVTVSQVTHSVAVTPGTAAFGARGSTRQLTAEARDTSGAPIPGKVAAWGSGNTAVVTVSGTGLVTSVADGATSVTATVDGINGVVNVTVAVLTATVVVTPGTHTFATLTRTRQLAAEARDSNANVIAGKVFAWSSNSAGVTVGAATGLVTAVTDGATATITASVDGKSGTATVNVVAVVATLSLAPLNTFTRLNQAKTVAVTAADTLGNALTTPALTWSSNATGVATVNNAGVVTSVTPGSATITASSTGGVSQNVTATVDPVAHSLAITPGTVAFGAIGSARQLATAVRDSGGTTIPGRTVTYVRVGPGTTATVSASGLVTSTAIGIGDSARADYAGADATLAAKAPITVSQVVFSVAVSSPSGGTPDTLKTTGRTRAFTATALDSNGNNVPGAPPMFWTSSANGVATVDVAGVVTAVADGTTQITAASGGVSGSRPMAVRRYAETFTLAPTTVTINTAGGTQVLNGTAQDSSGANLLISWLSRSTAVATVNPATGTSTTVSAVANGTTRVVMSGGTRSDSASVTIALPLVSFAATVQPIFTNSCAKANCHVGPVPTGNMNLSVGLSYNQIVNVAASGLGGQIRVIPGNANNSYLIRKLEGGPNIVGGQMPADGPPFLSAPTIQLIRDWINQGAQNN